MVCAGVACSVLVWSGLSACVSVFLSVSHRCVIVQSSIVSSTVDLNANASQQLQQQLETTGGMVSPSVTSAELEDVRKLVSEEAAARATADSELQQQVCSLSSSVPCCPLVCRLAP
jgi:hypothetical protein